MTDWKAFRLRAGGVAAATAVALVVAGCGGAGSSGAGSSGYGGGSSARSNSSTSSRSASNGSTSASAGNVVIGTAKGKLDTYLTGASGRALYLWLGDSGGKSQCSGACAGSWPPVIAKGQPQASGSAVAADLGTVARVGGAMQVTYKGHPLYYYAGDLEAGTTYGQGSDGFGAKWWLVAPSGAAITASSTDGSAASASGGSGGGSSGGGWS